MNITNTPDVIRQQLSVTFDWFLRVLEGQTYLEIARRYAVPPDNVRSQVAKLFRRLNREDIAVPGEVSPGLEDHKKARSLPDLLRRHKALYLARLHRVGATEGILPQIIDKELPALLVPVWTPELDAKLGTMSDMAFAMQLGTLHSVIRNRRLKLGIKSFAGGGCDGQCQSIRADQDAAAT